MSLIAPLTLLGFPQLFHLGYALLELDVLAFLVGVSLVLCADQFVSSTGSCSDLGTPLVLDLGRD